MKENPNNQYTIRSFSNRQCSGIEAGNAPKSPSSIPVFEAVIAQLRSKDITVSNFSNVFTEKQGATTDADKRTLLTSEAPSSSLGATPGPGPGPRPRPRPGKLTRGGAGASETPNLQNTLERDTNKRWLFGQMCIKSTVSGRPPAHVYVFDDLPKVFNALKDSEKGSNNIHDMIPRGTVVTFERHDMTAGINGTEEHSHTIQGQGQMTHTIAKALDQTMQSWTEHNNNASQLLDLFHKQRPPFNRLNISMPFLRSLQKLSLKARMKRLTKGKPRFKNFKIRRVFAETAEAITQAVRQNRGKRL